MKFLVLLLLLLPLSCGSEANNPEEGKILPIVDLDKIRTEIAESWVSFSAPSGTVFNVTHTEGEYFNSSDTNGDCHYIYDQVDYALTYTDDVISSIYRQLDHYTLGPDTTASKNYCNSNASGEDPGIALGFGIMGIFALTLDGWSTELSYNSSNKAFSFTEDPVAKLISIDQKTWNGLNVYTLNYEISGDLSTGQYNKLNSAFNFNLTQANQNAYLSFVVLGNVHIGAWVVAMKAKGLLDDGSVFDTYIPLVKNMDGVELPVL